jgi:hypothetical protein
MVAVDSLSLSLSLSFCVGGGRGVGAWVGWQESAVARYRLMSEQAAPPTPNFAAYMLKLLQLVMVSLDDDEDVYQAAFAAYDAPPLFFPHIYINI